MRHSDFFRVVWWFHRAVSYLFPLWLTFTLLIFRPAGQYILFWNLYWLVHKTHKTTDIPSEITAASSYSVEFSFPVNTGFLLLVSTAPTLTPEPSQSASEMPELTQPWPYPKQLLKLLLITTITWADIQTKVQQELFRRGMFSCYNRVIWNLAASRSGANGCCCLTSR